MATEGTSGMNQQQLPTFSWLVTDHLSSVKVNRPDQNANKLSVSRRAMLKWGTAGLSGFAMPFVLMGNKNVVGNTDAAKRGKPFGMATIQKAPTINRSLQMCHQRALKITANSSTICLYCTTKELITLRVLPNAVACKQRSENVASGGQKV